ncbi:Transmembrane BAX inhibitor motif-containing protein 1-like, related, partial [Eimeria tenella]
PGSMEMGSPPAPSDDTKITDHISVQIRHAFVRKVLGILAVQILFTFGIASVFGFVPTLRTFLLQNYWLAIVAAVCGLVLQLVLVCVPDLARKVPVNFILMTLITACYAVLISCAAAASSWESFLIAIGSTFVVVVGLMLFACQTKYDFTGCGTYLFVAVLCLMIFGILSIFFHNKIVHLVYSSIATVLFCMILVYDTQLVVGGKHRRYQYSVDDYIFAALTLYMDIIIIFMNILAIADNS